MISQARLEAAYQTALAALLKERKPEGHWVGELSSSALSTATAVMALHLVGKNDPASSKQAPHIAGGLVWLAAKQNSDGGWGDTTRSFSNISTTMLCRAAFYLTGFAASQRATVDKAEDWLFSRYGTRPAQLAEAVRHATARTAPLPRRFSRRVRLRGWWTGAKFRRCRSSWRCFLSHGFGFCAPRCQLRLARTHCHWPGHLPFQEASQSAYQARARAESRKKLRVLEKIQPESGGFLEAIPLTSFVTLSLAACGLAQHPVAKKGVQFLVSSVLPDGSWAIDSDLATWVTTLSINALAAAGEIENLNDRDELRDWLLKQQYRERHPYTGAAPGGWGWTPLSGGVPDADDTPGALLALAKLGAPERVHAATNAGLDWLANLQNRDGGWPTFCRGWGQLPFDRSGCDLTAHVLRALVLAHACLPRDEQVPGIGWGVELTLEDSQVYLDSGLKYLAQHQRPDGSWLPLWFGNQHAPDDENPTYGTTRVLAAYRDLHMMDTEPARRGVQWLLSVQNPEGGWGGAMNTPSSVEETALAVEVLVDAGPDAAASVNKGLLWLVEQVVQGGLHHPTPIGFYFAKLWYFEKLYPIIFTVAALGRARRVLGSIRVPSGASQPASAKR